MEVLRSRWLSMGGVTQQFQQEFAAFIGAKHCLAVANGTAALHLACLAIGLGPGDEVIVPSLTFVATANAVRYTGAMPVFADIESLDWLTISPSAIEACITERTRAILVMHYAGFACNMPAILEIAEPPSSAGDRGFGACHRLGAGWADAGDLGQTLAATAFSRTRT